MMKFLLLLFVLLGHANCQTSTAALAEEVNSFFAGVPSLTTGSRRSHAMVDEDFAASIRRSDRVLSRPSPFPALISPRVFIKNKGQPPQDNTPEQVNSAELSREEPSSRDTVQNMDLPLGPSESFPADNLGGLDQSHVSLPFVVEPKSNIQIESIGEFPEEFALEQERNAPPVDTQPNENSQLNEFFQPSSAIPRPINQRTRTTSDVNDRQRSNSHTSSRSSSNANNKSVVFLPPRDNSQRSEVPSNAWQTHALTSAKTPQKESAFLTSPQTVTSTAKSTNAISFWRSSPRFANNSLPSTFRQQARSTTPLSARFKTTTPVSMKDLDTFFTTQRAKASAEGRPKVILSKLITAQTIPALKATTTIRSTAVVSPSSRRQSDKMPSESEENLSKQRMSSVEDDSDDKTIEEEEEERPQNLRFRDGTGINPQFVDFATLVTKTHNDPNTNFRSSTPKVRTVIHPPPAFATAKSVRRATTTPSSTRQLSFSRSTVRSARPVQNRRVTTTFIENDPTQTFVDVPRVSSKTRSTTLSPRRFSTRRPFVSQTVASAKKQETAASTQSTAFKGTTSGKIISTPKEFVPKRQFDRPIFRDDVPVSNVQEDVDDGREVDNMRGHRFSKTSAERDEEDEELNTVSSTIKPPSEKRRPVITVQRIPRPLQRGFSRGNEEQTQTWKPVIIPQFPNRANDETQFSGQNQRDFQPTQRPFMPQHETLVRRPVQSFVRDNDEAPRQASPLTSGRTLDMRRPQRPFVQNSQKAPPALSNFDYVDEQPQQRPGEMVFEPEEPQHFQPSLPSPNMRQKPSTPRFQESPLSGEDDFPDENASYEVDDYDEEYELPPETTTRSTTIKSRPRRPNGFKPSTAAPSRPRKPTGVTRPAFATSRKPTKATAPPRPVVSSTKPPSNKISGSKLGKGKCDRSRCQLPNCYCGGRVVPGGLSPSEIPQMVLLTFDDAVNDLNWPLYQTLFFNGGRTNPNGCPILTTLYVSHEWTDYGKVEAMYAAGHEIASHSISHGDGAGFAKKKWHDEIYGQKEILSNYGGVNPKDIQGMRAPFLAIGGNKMFGMLHEDNFTYDSSVTVLENNPPVWPYTLDFGLPHECAIPPCPTRGFPGLWEIPMVSLTDSNGGRCSMADSCSYATTSDGVYDMLISNFKRHYESNRAPLGLYYHSSWFLTPHRREGFIQFLDDILQMDDVYLVTSMQLIEWMRNPTPLSQINHFGPWQCKNQRQPACRISRECNIPFRGDVRPFRTCGECPLIYPWVGKTNV